MGNPQSKATEQMPASDVPPGQMEEPSVDDYSPEIVAVSDVVDEIHPISPGMHGTLPQHTNCDITNVHQPPSFIPDNPAVSFINNEASLPVPSNLTHVYSADVAQSSSVALNVAKQTLKNGRSDEKREQYNARRRAAYRKKKEDGTVKRQDENQPSLPMSELASVQRIQEEKRELINARRRATYRKKTVEGTINLQDDVQNNPRPTLGDITNERQPTSVIPGFSNDTELESMQHDKEEKLDTASKLQDHVQTVPIPPLGDITNVHQPHQAISGAVLNDTKNTRRKRVEERNNNIADEKREKRNAQRRAAYRKKKEQLIQDENLPPLTISEPANPTSSTYTSFSHDDAPFSPSTTITSGVIHDKDLARRQRDNERKSRLTDDQKEQRNTWMKAYYRKKMDEVTTDDREKLNQKIREKRMQRRRSMNAIEKGESSAQRKAKYASRKNTPCAESIAMPCPDVTSTTSHSRAFTERASPVSQAAEAASPDGRPPMSMPTYALGTDEDTEAFLSRIMGDDPIPPDFMDDEYYLFGAQGSDVESMDGGEAASMSSAERIDIDPFDYVYSNLSDCTHILKHAANCDHCKAKKFESETDGFCCRNGQIELKEPDPIPELMRLWSSTDADSRHFRENIRFFNGHFSFTTLGVSLDENYTNMKSGVYTFRAHGTIYHNVHSFGPSSRPEHLQLYFYDDDPNLTYRKAATKDMDQNVVKKLVDILRGNPYTQQFRSLGAHKDNLDDYRIDLNTDQRLDQRKYNRPVSSEVAAIWVEGTDLAKRFDRRITLCGNDNQRHSIHVTDGSYDPLSYPLFYPRGELGWHPKQPKRNVPWEVVQQPRGGHDDMDAEGNSRLCVSVRDYYCYRLQTRPAIFNPILCGARLLQQWGVDMYIKIESCRLKWYRKNQTKIRADLYKGVVNAITSGETRASTVGIRIVLPGTFERRKRIYLVYVGLLACFYLLLDNFP